MILMIIKVYGAEICVFMASLRDVTSGLSLLGDFFGEELIMAMLSGALRRFLNFILVAKI